MNPSPNPKALAVIPARFASTRFPGKVIAPLAGKPLVVSTYERASSASRVNEAVVATDDQRVVDAVSDYGVPVVLTRGEHASGTDRIAEVVTDRQVEFVVNVQGDEPLIDPVVILSLIHI